MPPIISLEPSQRPNSRAMGMAVRDLETKLVRHAAPTLAGIKPANLFTYRTANFTEEEASSAIAEISSRLAGFHLRVEPLANRARGVLLLVFRPELVESALDNEHARKLLTQSSKTFPLKASYLKSSAASKLLTLRAQHLSKRIAKPRPRPNPNDSFLAAPRGTTTTMARITFASAEQKPRFREKNSKPRKANRHSHTKSGSFLATFQPMWRDSSL